MPPLPAAGARAELLAAGSSRAGMALHLLCAGAISGDGSPDMKPPTPSLMLPRDTPACEE